MKLDDCRRRIDKVVAEYNHACSSVSDERKRLLAIRSKLKDAEQAQQVLQTVAQITQESAHRQIAGVVTRCLSVVFGENAYEFKIHFDRKRGKTEARLVFEREGVELSDPLNEVGGGVTDVAAFALRLACLLLAKPNRRRLIVADEAFRFVSKEYRPNVVMLLETLADELDMQFILVSHDEEFQIGKVVRL